MAAKYVPKVQYPPRKPSHIRRVALITAAASTSRARKRAIKA